MTTARDPRLNVQRMRNGHLAIQLLVEPDDPRYQDWLELKRQIEADRARRGGHPGAGAGGIREARRRAGEVRR